MADATFRIGSAVECSDGPAGTVTRVVIDPVARTLTHLVVEPRHRLGLGRLVPLELADTVDGAVRLRCTTDELEALPAAEETDFLPGGSGYADYEAHEAYYWPYYGLAGGVPGADPTLADTAGIYVRDTLPTGELGVRRGDRVHATDGEIGKVEGLVVQAADGRVTHVLLQEGHLWGRKQVAIPADTIERIDEEIHVRLSKHEIEALPPVDVAGHPR